MVELSNDVYPHISKTSRYAGSKVIRIRCANDQEYVTFETFKDRNYEPPSSLDKFTTITPTFEYRPDLMSYDLYGIPDFWWRLLQVNNMKDIMEFKVGRNIRVPSNLLV
jgi:hypothetical protein